MNYPGQSLEAECQTKGIGRRSTLDSLKDRKKDAQERMAKIDEAISLFEKNPELARALDLLGSIGGRNKMKNRTDKEIKIEIKRLQKERKSIKEYSAFDHNNWESIDKSIEILQQYLDDPMFDMDEILEEAERQYGANGYMECGEKYAIDFIEGY